MVLKEVGPLFLPASRVEWNVSTLHCAVQIDERINVLHIDEHESILRTISSFSTPSPPCSLRWIPDSGVLFVATLHDIFMVVTDHPYNQGITREGSDDDDHDDDVSDDSEDDDDHNDNVSDNGEDDDHDDDHHHDDDTHNNEIVGADNRNSIQETGEAVADGGTSIVNVDKYMKGGGDAVKNKRGKNTDYNDVDSNAADNYEDKNHVDISSNKDIDDGSNNNINSQQQQNEMNKENKKNKRKKREEEMPEVTVKFTDISLLKTTNHTVDVLHIATTSFTKHGQSNSCRYLYTKPEGFVEIVGVRGVHIVCMCACYISMKIY